MQILWEPDDSKRIGFFFNTKIHLLRTIEKPEKEGGKANQRDHMLEQKVAQFF